MEESATCIDENVQNESAPHPTTNNFGLFASPVFWLAAVLAVLGIAYFTAEHWTKVDQEAVWETVHVPTGEWAVNLTEQDVCFPGESYETCLLALTIEWNNACAERSLDEESKTLCNLYYEGLLSLSAQGYDRYEGSLNYIITTRRGGTGMRLQYKENTVSDQIITVPAVTHEATCYLGFLGECK